MKKTVIFMLTAALAFSLIGPADAKKKKPKKTAPATPVSLQFYLRSDEACEAPFLSLTDAEDGDCIYGDTGFYDALGDDFTQNYVAADGVPLVLDVTKPVTGSIGIRGWNTAGGVGMAEIDLVLLATIGGEEKELGTYNEAYTVGPAETHMVEFEMALDPALAGLTVETLTLAVNSHGTTAGGRGVEHDEPVASMTIPALK